MLNRGEDPWAAGLYDIVIPMDKTDPAAATALILEKAKSDVVARTAHSQAALDDFLLAAQVDVKLAQEGHNVSVDANKGAITLTINKNVLMLSRLEEDLKSIVEKVPGVTQCHHKNRRGFLSAGHLSQIRFRGAVQGLAGRR